MTIIHSGTNSFAVHIPYSDPIISNCKDDVSMINRVLTELPNFTGSKASVEIYPGKTDLMMFINYIVGFFAVPFFTFENLLHALPALPKTSFSALYYVDNMYILLIKAFPEAQKNPQNSFPADGNYRLHLSEHGKCLINKNAIAFLALTFNV